MLHCDHQEATAIPILKSELISDSQICSYFSFRPTAMSMDHAAALSPYAVPMRTSNPQFKVKVHKLLNIMHFHDNVNFRTRP